MTEFSRLLLIVCVLITLASILYFFYWNRFIGLIIGRVIRLLYWDQESSSIWVEIGSIHFSILTGRILLKDVRYHSSNQTIKIVTGKIQWRYWIRRPTTEEDLGSLRNEDAKEFALLSCRIQVSLQGLEWFIYNRTTAYDGIVDQMERQARPGSRSSSHRRFFTRFTRQETSSLLRIKSLTKSAIPIPSVIRRGVLRFKQQMPTLDPKDLLPLGIKVQTGAIILGNPSTPSLLVAEFENALGTYSTTSSRSKYDCYKQVLSLRFINNHVRFMQNDDYVDPKATMGELVHNGIKQHTVFRKYTTYRSYRSFMKMWRQVGLYKLVVDYFATRRAQRRDQNHTASSIPYRKPKNDLEKDVLPGLDFSAFEYAVERRILEAPLLELTYYVDAVGDVPSHSIPPRYSENGIYDIGNGDTDPEWGIDLVVHAGVLRYGPWADRQRTELQRAFFPPTYHNSETSQRLKPGDKRAWTSLQVFIELREDTTLHIPFREASKDWQWDGLVEVPQRPRKREAAMLNITVADRSSINYRLPMVIGPQGYESALEVHLDAITVTSSLNDIRLVSSESARIRCELPTPLGWDVQRTWVVAMYLRQPILFLLRDHINMFSDLGRDWASGPPTDYRKFVAMVYVFRLEMHHFDLNLYANDQNIVDKPLVKEENVIINLRGPHLKSTTTIPLHRFRPEYTVIPFNIVAPDLALDISLPRWNIHALQVSSGALNLMKIVLFELKGSYMYYAQVREENVEQLKLDFNIKDPTYYAYGWSIRYFMILRDNYIGSFTHFQTLSEYLNKRRQKLPVGDPIKLKYRPGKANMLEATLCVVANNARVIQPINLVGPSHDLLLAKFGPPRTEPYQIELTTPEIQVQLRTHDYYMDMSLNIDTIIGSIKRKHKGPVQDNSWMLSDVLMIDGLDITANRLFGSQPRTATYACIWEISTGKIKGSFTPNEVNLLAAAGNSFRMNITDILNAPAEEFLPPLDLDVTFYKITTKAVEITLKAGNASLLVSLSQGIKFDSNDLGAHQYRKMSSLRIPYISLNVLLTKDGGRNSWLEAAEIYGDAYVDVYFTPIGHRLVTRNQLAFIEEQDRLTNRAKLIFSHLRHRPKSSFYAERTTYRNGLYLPQPALPNTAQRIPARTAPQDEGSTAPEYVTSLRFSAMENVSESEGEEWVSEADRDARLARTRTSTPITYRPENTSQSSMDESDDADLTDGESSGDDWSDMDDLPDSRSTGSLLSFYSPILRHYTFNWGRDIIFWDGPAFSQIKTGDPFLHFNHAQKLHDPTQSSSSYKPPDDVPKNEDVTTIRVKFINPVGAVFNPLLCQAILLFTEDIASDIPNPALLIDTLLGKVISKRSAIGAKKCVVLDINLPNAVLQVMQHIAMSDDSHPDVSEAMQSRNVPSNLDVVTVTTSNVNDLHLGGVFSQNSSSLKVSVQQITGTMNMPITKRSVSSALESDIIYLTLSSSALDLSRCILSSTFGSIVVKVGHRGPEFLVATCLALAGVSSSILSKVQTLRSRNKATERRIIAHVLKASERQSIIDPLSTIQPSYLVQSGVPHTLRADPAFKFFYHLQNCLCSTYTPAFPCNSPSDDVPADDLMSTIEERLALLDPDASTFEHLSSIDNMFNPQDDNLSKVAQRHVGQMTTRFTDITTLILDTNGGRSGQLSITDLVISSRWKMEELLQINLGNPLGASQTSLRSKNTKAVQIVTLAVSLGDIDLVVSPQLMHFAEHVLRIKKQFSVSDANDVSSSRRSLGEISERHVSKMYCLQIYLSIHRLCIRAAAENLVLVMGVGGAQVSTSILLFNTRVVQSVQQNLLCNTIYIQGRSPTDPAKENDSDILAGLDFGGVRASLIFRAESGPRNNIKIVLGLEGLRLHVPRSALRLYHFVGQWRADYLPGYEAALKTLISEYSSKSTKPVSPTPSRQSRRRSSLQLHTQIHHFEISLQVMHGTWLSWEVHKVVSYGQLFAAPTSGQAYAFGLQIRSMSLNISSVTNLKEPPTTSRIRLMLPPLSLSGNSDGHTVQMLILFDYIELKLKPSHWDTLLAVQQKFGQDFNDLVSLIQNNRGEENTSTTLTPSKQGLQYEGYLKMKGFRIGLEGDSSTVFLECQDINGEITNVRGWSWDLWLSDLALSLAPRMNSVRRAAFNRNHKSAFVIIDFGFHGSASDMNRDKFLRLSIIKIHAVMQPSSVGEFGDFVDNLQAELLQRQEQRSLELAAFKDKTQHVLRTFDVNLGEIQLEQTSWFNDLMISVSISNIGVAFPFTYDETLELSQENKKLTPTRAFLFSVKSIKFETHRGETGHAIVQHLSFQFVSGFRQSSPEDFVAENHHTRNWLLYPEMKAQLRSSTMAASRKIWIKADVTGFVLDIDSTISSYIFSLVDVYRLGKERVERLATNAPRTPMATIPPIEIVKPSAEKRYSAIPTSNIFGQLTFQSGKVRLYSQAAGQLFKTNISSSSKFVDVADEQILALGAEVFNLPVVSVWSEYRATPAFQKLRKDIGREPSVLMFNSTVFSSQNTLRPSLLPFLTELINQIEERMRKTSARSSHQPSLLSRPSDSLQDKDEDTGPVSSIQITFSLRIDKSKLELTCQPDVNVVAGLHWESGGFVINVSPGARKVSFFGSIGELTIGLKHGFLSEDCLKLDARNLTFSVGFAKMESEHGQALNSISVVLDTEFLGAVRFSRLQDILCFKAVWLDRIPILNNQFPTEPTNPAHAIATWPAEQSQTGFSTAIMLRVRGVQLDIDLGQSISKVKLELHQSVVQTKLTDDFKEVLLHIGDVSITAQGNLSGNATVSSCVFQTIRRSEDSLKANQNRSRMLELRLTSGSLSVSLDSDHQRLLLYRAKPLQVEILDDWSQISVVGEDKSRPLFLSFNIKCPEITAIVNVGTIPKLLSYKNKFKANLDSQRQGASRESQTFRVSRMPKPNNPLSAVAEAMLHSARLRFTEPETDPYVIKDNLSVQLDLLRLIVFPRTMRDLETAQFIGQDVHARLGGTVSTNTSITYRDLHLSFSSMVISKFTQVAHAIPMSLDLADEQDRRDWLSALFKNSTEAIIVGLPSMKIHMFGGMEIMPDGAKRLTYSFFSHFVRREGMKAFEDIYITLNMSLYSWLTVLRKNLTREMEQVRATEDWRMSIGTATSAMSHTGSNRKKNTPNPLILSDSPRSTTLPSGGMSAFSPSPSRLGWDYAKPPASAKSPSLLGEASPSSLQLPLTREALTLDEPQSQDSSRRNVFIYTPIERHIERLTMRQLGEATPDVMHPFFMKKAGFNLEDSLPQYIHEYATQPLDGILEVLLKLYCQQLLAAVKKT